MEDLMEKLVSLCKRRGFIFPSSEIYGGFGGFWDKGPLGVVLAKRIKDLWWQEFVEKRDDILGLDASIIMNPKVWEASGHTGSGFTDPLKECKKCHHRFRADHLKENKCPDCKGELTEEKNFNILVKTFIGPVEDQSSQAYLRGETAQGIFVNFKNVLDSLRPRVPFGIAQIGKAFRNEITPGNFIFRSREFEQMELEYFVRPEESGEQYKKWIKDCFDFVLFLGVKKENLRMFEHPKEKLSHYSKGTTDIEYKLPSGWGEIWGIANRGDYDLNQHSKFSQEKLAYTDPSTKEKFVPYVIEPSVGVERLMLAVLLDAYSEEEVANDEKRIVMRFSPLIAPIKAAVFPLVSNKPQITSKAKEVYDLLRPHFSCVYDDISNIGKRYRRQDEIGTPWCVTIDFETLEKEDVTLRDRDTMSQQRVKIADLADLIKGKINA